MLEARARRRGEQGNLETARDLSETPADLAVVVGYGPVGQSVDRVIRAAGIDTVVVDMNVATVRELTSEGRPALFGDASHENVLRQAGVERARYLRERRELEQAGASAASFEETEAAVALTTWMLRDLGCGDAEIAEERERLRRELGDLVSS